MEFSEEKKEKNCRIRLFSLLVIVVLFFIFISVALSIRNDRIIERPNIYVNSASANPFAIFVSTSPITPNWKITFITAVWNFTFGIQNPNEKFVMPFSRFDFNVSYGKDVLSTGSIEPFELKKKELKLVMTTNNALPITLSEQAAKRMEDELQKSKAVNFHITLKGIMEGSVVLTWRQIVTHCENLKMLFSSDHSAGKMLGASECQVLWCYENRWNSC